MTYEQEQREKMGALQNQAGTAQNSRLSSHIPTPREPGIRDRIQELCGYLAEIEAAQVYQRERLCGPSPTDVANSKLAHEPGIEELLAMACQKAACLAGEAKSINNRL